MSRVSFLVLWAATSLLVVAFSTMFVSGWLVRDIDGKPVQIDLPYYALSNTTTMINRTEQAGISGLSYTRNGSTLIVLHEPYSFNNSAMRMGIPLAISLNFSPQGNDTDIGPEDVLTIGFYPKELTTTWQLGEVDNATGNSYVTLRGDDERVHEDNYWFKIKRGRNSTYRIVSTTKNGTVEYGKIGISSNNETRKLLSIQEKSLFIQFEKARVV